MSFLVCAPIMALTLVLQMTFVHAQIKNGCEAGLAGSHPVDPSAVRQAFRARDLWAELASRPESKRLAELRAKTAPLRAQVDKLKSQLNPLTRLLGRLMPMGDDHLLYDIAREALRQNVRDIEDLEGRQRREVNEINLALEKHVASLGKSMLLSALIDPPPVWARNLSVINVEVNRSNEREPARSFTAVVNLIADPKPNPSGKASKTSRPYTVIMRATRGETRLEGGVVLDEKLRLDNPYHYDFFRPGRVFDRRLDAVAHTSLDARISQLHLHHVPDEVRDRIVTRQREHPVLRRQVQQVLFAAAKLRRVQSADLNVSASERELLKAYLNYWAHAKQLTPDNMLKSALMIRGLLATASQQRTMAEVLRAEVDRGVGAFSRDRVKLALALRTRQARQYAPAQTSPSSTTSDGGDDFMMWAWFWSARHDTTYVGPQLPFHPQLTEAMGVKSVDDPAFIMNEYSSDPLNTAVDTYTSETGQTVESHGPADAMGDSASSSESSGGGGGDGDGDGDGDGG